MLRAESRAWLGLLGRALWGGLSVSLLLAALVMLVGPAEAAGEQAGLRIYATDGAGLGNAPSLDTRIAIGISGVIARVRVEQRFYNPHKDWVEGVYVFPLPQNAAVDRLRMRYGGRLIEGEIQERQQARQNYERARDAGQGAGLLEQQRANVFTTAVANIPPGEAVAIEIEYQHDLAWQDGGFSLRLPLVVAPRYIPGAPMPGALHGFSAHGWAGDTDQVPDASQITPPVAVSANDSLNPVTITVDLNAGLDLAEVVSASHRIDVVRQSHGHYRIGLARGKVPAERDFVLSWRPLLGQQPSAALFTEVWEGRHYGLLMLMPPQATALPQRVGRELVLVVDTSGSMHGDSIEQARAALLRALQQLGPGDRFNVIQFNTDVHALFDRARPADQVHLQQAKRYVTGLRADGGTEMLPAMRLALRDPSPSGLLRQVVFLTDGAVGNEQALFEAVAQEIGASRLFTVGIGSAPNALFMTRAAQAGRGTFTYIDSGAQVQGTIDRLFRQLSAPVLTDLRLHWRRGEGDAAVQQAPVQVADLYAGEPLIVAVAADGAPTQVDVAGRFGTVDWQQSVTLSGGAALGGIHALWARRMIDDWLARHASGEDGEVVRQSVLQLALEHRLVSRYTSLVAIEHTPVRPADAPLKSGALPVRLPAGWSASAVFGRLPGTATPAPLFLMLGLACLALAWVLRRRWI